jgi:hypothetical protein
MLQINKILVKEWLKEQIVGQGRDVRKAWQQLVHVERRSSSNFRRKSWRY